MAPLNISRTRFPLKHQCLCFSFNMFRSDWAPKDGCNLRSFCISAWSSSSLGQKDAGVSGSETGVAAGGNFSASRERFILTSAESFVQGTTAAFHLMCLPHERRHTASRLIPSHTAGDVEHTATACVCVLTMMMMRVRHCVWARRYERCNRERIRGGSFSK